jgi:hypothetical protein
MEFAAGMDYALQQEQLRKLRTKCLFTALVVVVMIFVVLCWFILGG